MRKIYFLATAVATLTTAFGAHAQDYAYGRGYLPPPAYAYYGVHEDRLHCSDRFTIVGAHAGVTVLGIDVGVGGAASVGGDCYERPRREHIHPAYAPPIYPPQAYAPPPCPQACAPSGYGQPSYGPPPPAQPYAPYGVGMGWQGQGFVPPCGCAGPQGW